MNSLRAHKMVVSSRSFDSMNYWRRNIPNDISLKLQVRWMPIFFQREYKNCWLKFNRIFSICVNNPVAIIDNIRFQQTVKVQTIFKVVPTIILCSLIRRNIVRFGIHNLKIGRFWNDSRLRKKQKLPRFNVITNGFFVVAVS